MLCSKKTKKMVKYKTKVVKILWVKEDFIKIKVK